MRIIIALLIALASIGTVSASMQTENYSVLVVVTPVQDEEQYRFNVKVEASVEHYAPVQYPSGVVIYVPMHFSVGMPNCVGDCHRPNHDLLTNQVTTVFYPGYDSTTTTLFSISAPFSLAPSTASTITAIAGDAISSTSFALDGEVLPDPPVNTGDYASGTPTLFVSTPGFTIRKGYKAQIDIEVTTTGWSQLYVDIPDGIEISEGTECLSDQQQADLGLCDLQKEIVPDGRTRLSSPLIGGGVVILRLELTANDSAGGVIDVHVASPQLGYAYEAITVNVRD